MLKTFRLIGDVVVVVDSKKNFKKVLNFALIIPTKE